MTIINATIRACSNETTVAIRTVTNGARGAFSGRHEVKSFTLAIVILKRARTDVNVR